MHENKIVIMSLGTSLYVFLLLLLVFPFEGK